MKRIWSHAVSVVALGVATAAVAPACVEQNETIFVKQLMAPSLNRQNGTCLYTPDPAQPALFEGALDVGIRDDYTGIFLVGNQEVARGDPTSARAESNRVTLQGMTSRVTNLDGSTIREFTSYGTGFSDVGAANTPGWGLFGGIVLDAATKDILAQGLTSRTATKTVLANVKIFGKTLGGIDVETGEFQFPIRVCNGCLVTFDTGNDPAVQPQPNCAKAGSGGTQQTSTTFPCQLGQDERVPCELCVNDHQVCKGG